MNLHDLNPKIHLETGFSDHHKIVFSIYKHTFDKEPPKIIWKTSIKKYSILESKIADGP